MRKCIKRGVYISVYCGKHMSAYIAPRDNIQVVAIFNSQLTALLQDLGRVIPSHPELVQSRSAIMLLIHTSPAMIIKMWSEFIYKKYAAMIDVGDVGFFVAKDYSADLVKTGNANHILGVIDRLRVPMRDIDPVNYPRVMKYVQNLSKLAAIYDAC